MKSLGQDLIDVIAPPGNSDMIIQKLRNEVDYSVEREIVREEGKWAKEAGLWECAIRCAEIAQNARDIVEIAEKTGNIQDMI